MKVLVACEYSGEVREAFAALGHDAWSCDLLPTEKPGNHIQGDVRDIIGDGWDLMIAHPPCTYLTNAGTRWLFDPSQPTRWDDMREGARFFLDLYTAPISKIAVENPIMHGHAKRLIAREPTQIIQPWQHGHGETKATCLWLKNLPPLRPSHIVEGREPRIHFMPPSEDRWKERSRTLPGIARAMAEQWGGSNRQMYQPELFDEVHPA